MATFNIGDDLGGKKITCWDLSEVILFNPDNVILIQTDQGNKIVQKYTEIYAEYAASESRVTIATKSGDTWSITPYMLEYGFGNITYINSDAEAYKYLTRVMESSTVSNHGFSGSKDRIPVYSQEEVYTNSEIDTKLAGKSNTSHNHDSRYYKKSEAFSKSDVQSMFESVGYNFTSSGSAERTIDKDITVSDKTPIGIRFNGGTNDDLVQSIILYQTGNKDYARISIKATSTSRQVTGTIGVIYVSNDYA